jgi:hypothetical protein
MPPALSSACEVGCSAHARTSVLTTADGFGSAFHAQRDMERVSLLGPRTSTKGRSMASEGILHSYIVASAVLALSFCLAIRPGTASPLCSPFGSYHCTLCDMCPPCSVSSGQVPGAIEIHNEYGDSTVYPEPDGTWIVSAGNGFFPGTASISEDCSQIAFTEGAQKTPYIVWLRNHGR